ncbi:MAG: phosphotransferase [bacterium]
MKNLLVDEVLPQMALAMDTDSMRAVFQRKLFGMGSQPNGEKSETSRFEIEACAIDRVKYKPGKNCLVLYRLGIRDRQTRSLREQTLCTRIYEPGGAHLRFLKAQSQRLVTPELGKPLMHIPEIDMVVWTFPNERKLQALPEIADLAFLRWQIVPELVARNFGANWMVEDVSHEIVHYVPEHTCTIRLDVQLHDTVFGNRRKVAIFGKTYYNEEGEATYHLMQQLWQSASRRNKQFLMAQPLGYSSELKTLWQLGLPGRTLQECDLGHTRALRPIALAGITLAKLHTISLNPTQTVQLAHLQERLEEMKRLLAQVRPGCSEILFKVTAQLQRRAKQLETQPLATLHGDLHLKNFLIDADQVALIDLDNVCTGPPAFDIGSFAATIQYLGLLHRRPRHWSENIIRVFRHYYQHNVPWQIRESDFNWYVAAALIHERAFRCLTRLKAGRLEIVEALLQLAYETLSNRSRGI